MNGESPSATAREPAGELASDYRRFLELLPTLGSAVDIDQEEGWTRVAWKGEVLCRCRRQEDVVQLCLGPDDENTLRCASHEEFRAVLAGIMQRLRRDL